MAVLAFLGLLALTVGPAAWVNVGLIQGASVTDSYLGTASPQADGTKIDVKILIKPDGAAAYVPIAAANQNVLPGQLIDLTTKVTPDTAVVTKRL